MISLPIISIVCCLAYIIFILFKFGVPVSLSETYYLLNNKWDWLFSAWCVLTSVPLGIYWFWIAAPALKWIPIVVMIAMLFIGVSCRYKSGPKPEDTIVYSSCSNKAPSNNIKDFFKNLKEKFASKEFLKYGWTRPIHYINSLIAIILTTIYICIVSPSAILSTIFYYVMFILIGTRVDGVYNAAYSADVDNKAWIFFMEVICFLNLFIFFWL